MSARNRSEQATGVVPRQPEGRACSRSAQSNTEFKLERDNASTDPASSDQEQQALNEIRLEFLNDLALTVPAHAC